MNYRSQPLSSFTHYLSARRLYVVAVALPLLAMAAQAANLTWRQGDSMRARAVDNVETDLRLAAPRGNVLDREGRLLATNERCWSVTFSAYGRSDDEARATLQRLATRLDGLTPERIDEIVAARPRSTRHALARRASQEQVLPILHAPEEYGGVRLQEDFRRQYPYPQELSLLVGHVGKIPEDKAAEYPRPRYLPDDEVGRAGIEKRFEDELSGKPGVERLRRNARGRLLSDPEILEPAHAGHDLRLAIDAEWQRQAYRLLGREMGTITVIDVSNGDVVVMASTPYYDSTRPGAMTLPSGEKAGFLNKAALGLYPPASTFKIVGAAAALRSGMTPTETVDCQGPFQLDGWQRPFWCNVRTGHGHLNMSGSLKVSCNVFFYELAAKLGPAPLREEAMRFGYGTATGLELAERSGNMPALEQLKPGEATNFSIGQGKLLATPLQVVRSFAALANGGRLVRPRLVTHIGTTAVEPAFEGSLELSSVQREAIIHGLNRAVNEQGGTVFKAHLPSEWHVVGKSGTAENSSGGVDAWFAGFFPREAPRYAFVVHVESADGHGGEVAGPIGRGMIEAILAPAKEVAAAPGE